MNDKVETADILGGVSMQKEDDHTSLAAADVNAFKEESSHEGQNAETDIDQSAEHRDNAEERHLEEKSSEEGNEAETEKLRLQDDSVLAKAEREGPVCVDDDVNNESKAAMDKNPDVDDRSEIESMEICKQSDSDLQLSSSPPSADILPSDTSVQHSESNVNKSSAFIKVESELPGNSDEATGMNSELKQMEASTTGTDRTDELERRLQEADELNSQLQAKAIGLQALYIRQVPLVFDTYMPTILRWALSLIMNSCWPSGHSKWATCSQAVLWELWCFLKRSQCGLSLKPSWCLWRYVSSMVSQ